MLPNYQARSPFVLKHTISVYIVLLHESECDMVKYFMSRLIYFTSQRRVKIKPESEISSHITQMSVISGLFHTRYLHWSSFLVNQGVKLMKTH